MRERIADVREKIIFTIPTAMNSRDSRFSRFCDLLHSQSTIEKFLLIKWF